MEKQFKESVVYAYREGNRIATTNHLGDVLETFDARSKKSLELLTSRVGKQVVDLLNDDCVSVDVSTLEVTPI